VYRMNQPEFLSQRKPGFGVFTGGDDGFGFGW
jgi:hypothetical protein